MNSITCCKHWSQHYTSISPAAGRPANICPYVKKQTWFQEFSLSIIFILPVFSSSLFSVIITVKAVLGQFAADLTVWRLSPSPVCYSRSSGWKTASEKWIINQPWDTLMLFKMRTLSHSWTGEPTQSCSMMGWWMFDDCRYLETTSRGAENTFHVQTW